MSLAQRRTTLDGIDTISSAIPEDDVFGSADGSVSPRTTTEHGERRESAASDQASIPVEDNKEVWQAISYDPFAQTGPPQLQHYESFPPELSANVAAYEVSTTRRICLYSMPLHPMHSGSTEIAVLTNIHRPSRLRGHSLRPCFRHCVRLRSSEADSYR